MFPHTRARRVWYVMVVRTETVGARRMQAVVKGRIDRSEIKGRIDRSAIKGRIDRSAMHWNVTVASSFATLIICFK